jgi:hypothetical protein
MQERNGIIAILDALGASNYSKDEIAQFLESRRRVLSLLDTKAERILGKIDADRLSTFTFNDTIVIVYETKPQMCLEDIIAFCTVLRHFEVASLAQGILFRGAVSIGSFYSDEPSNTIMGKAVTDAAAWYNLGNWIGIAATPQATLLIRSYEQQAGEDMQHVMIDYPVPMKRGASLSLRALNWPKGFYVKGLRPLIEGENPRAKCLELLVRSGVPKGTETKYFNTVAFFEYCVRHWKKEIKRKNPSAS